MTTTVTCPAAQRLHKQLQELGWETCISYARGPVEFTEFGPVRGDGTRPKIVAKRELDSALVRACHPRRQGDDMPWALVALWIQDGVTERGKPRWACDMAYIPGVSTPQRIGSSEVKAYLDRFSQPATLEEAAA